MTKGTLDKCSSSDGANPPSGPIRMAAFWPCNPAKASEIGRAGPISAQTRRGRPAGQSARTAGRSAGAWISGTQSRSDCSAASMALAVSRSRLTRLTSVWRVRTGQTRLAPSSEAFSAIRSVPSRLMGEQEPQVWHIFLRTKQFFEFCRAVILGESFDTPQPFAIPPVEKGNFHPGGETQYIPEIMHLRNRQRDSLSKRKIFRDIKACAKRQGHNRAG